MEYGNFESEKKIKFSSINQNSEFLWKNSKQERNKNYNINFDSKKNLTPKNFKIKNYTKENLLKSKTIFINKDSIFNDKSSEKSNTFNSKSQSYTPPLFDSDKLNKQKRNSNMYSDSIYQNEINEQEQLLSFHINDNKSNKKYKISNNRISTTKYNYLTFLPKGLLLQFTRLPNIFSIYSDYPKYSCHKSTNIINSYYSFNICIRS